MGDQQMRGMIPAIIPGVVIDPGEGKVSTAGPSTTVFKLTGDQTDGQITLIEQSTEPGVLIPPHVHQRFDEITYVLTGELTFELGSDVMRAPAGSVVFRPRGVRHAFWNSGDEPARVIEVYCPAGHERLFEGLAKLQAEGSLELPRVLELGYACDTEYDLEHAAELAARYNLRMPGPPPPTT